MLIVHQCDKITDNDNLGWYLFNPSSSERLHYNVKVLESIRYVRASSSGLQSSIKRRCAEKKKLPWATDLHACQTKKVLFI